MILVTGPEHSGTGVVAAILREAGGDVVHRAVPHFDDWSEAVRQANKADRVVIVIRGLCAHRASLGPARAANREAALALLGEFLRDWRATVVVTYESLREPAEVEALCREVGLDPAGVSTRVEDRNAKHYRTVPAASDAAGLP